MRPRILFAALLPVALSCTGSEPTPTEIKPEFAPSCTPAKATVLAPAAVSRTENSTGSTKFTVKNNCTVTLGGLTFRSSRTGQVISVGAPSPATANLSPGQSIAVFVAYTTGAPGTGTVVLTATTDPGDVSTGAQTVTVVAGNGPVVTTNAATAVKTSSATLNGSANPGGLATTAWFRLDTLSPGAACNDSYGTRVPESGGVALSGSTATPYSSGATNLIGGMLYYVCAIAGNSSGTGVGTVQTFRAGGNALRFGLTAGVIGAGAGGQMYSYTLDATPSPTDIHQQIQLADQHDVVFMVAPSGGRGRWTIDGVFNWAKYEESVMRFADDTMFARAVKQRRVLLYVVDEPNKVADFHGTISPTTVNEMGKLHKRIWDGALTFVRATGSTLEAGWAGPDGVTRMLPPPEGYTAIDYAWLQYSAQHTEKTFAAAYADEKLVTDRLQMGLVPGLNWWGGGIGLDGQQSLDGVLACWNIDYPGTRSGYIIGVDQVGEGTLVDCNQLSSTVNRVVASPAWIKKWADVVYGNPDYPFAAIWTAPADGKTIPGSVELGAREDFVGALSHAITMTASRATWSGYRTPKPKPAN